MDESRTALVTGASGYIGGLLVPRLLADGWKVRALVRDRASIMHRPWAGRVEVVAGDASDPAALDAALSSVDVANAQADLRIAEQEWRRVSALGREAVSGRRINEAQVALDRARATAQAYGLPGTAAGRSSGRPRTKVSESGARAPAPIAK